MNVIRPGFSPILHAAIVWFLYKTSIFIDKNSLFARSPFSHPYPLDGHGDAGIDLDMSRLCRRRSCPHLALPTAGAVNTDPRTALAPQRACAVEVSSNPTVEPGRPISAGSCGWRGCRGVGDRRWGWSRLCKGCSHSPAEQGPLLQAACSRWPRAAHVREGPVVTGRHRHRHTQTGTDTHTHTPATSPPGIYKGTPGQRRRRTVPATALFAPGSGVCGTMAFTWAAGRAGECGGRVGEERSGCPPPPAPRPPTPPGSPQVPPGRWRCCGCWSAPRETPAAAS